MTTDAMPLVRYVRAHDWARIVSLLALPPSAVPADVITAIEAKTAVKRSLAERDERAAILRECRTCDEFGWLLDDLGVPAEPARKCPHGRDTHAGVDVTTLQHRPLRSFDEPIHQRADPDETRR